MITLVFISLLVVFTGCQSSINRPNDKVIEDFISSNNIEVVELVKYKQYTAIAYKNDKEIGFYLDQTGGGTFSKHETLIDGKDVPNIVLGGFKDKYIVAYITDEQILGQIDIYKTRSGTFKRKINQKCFVYPTGRGIFTTGIHYFDKNGKEIAV